MPDFLTTSDGEKIAYEKSDGHGPTLIWCGGLKSDMEGSKATHLHNWAKTREQAFIRFDYFGHGQSSGEFTNGTLSQWADDIATVRDQLCDGPVIFIGSSMGGWASLLAAIANTPRTAGLVLINPAPDFTEKLTVANWTEDQIKALENDGVVYEPSGYEEPYAYSKALIEDGKARQVLDHPIPLTCPIRILQGYEDAVVPWAHSKRLLDMLTSKDVTYTLVSGGDHSLSRPSDLSLIESAILSLS